jgi:lysophospholipase L1-like esterase
MDENTAEETLACMTRARDLIGPNAEAILDAIADARAGCPGIVRVILPHRFFWDAFVAQGLADVAGEQWDLMNERTAAAAREHGFPVLDLGTVLMGPNRDQDPMASGLVVDGIHLTDEGTARAVEALLELGLDDAPPVGG